MAILARKPRTTGLSIPRDPSVPRMKRTARRAGRVTLYRRFDRFMCAWLDRTNPETFVCTTSALAAFLGLCILFFGTIYAGVALARALGLCPA